MFLRFYLFHVVTFLPRDAMLARRAVYAVGVCSFVCLSVRPSQAGIVSKRPKIGSCKQRRTIAQGLCFPGAEDLMQRNSNEVTPNGGRHIEVG